MSELKRGTKVRIAIGCTATKDGWGYNGDMKKMEGTVQTVERARETSNGVRLRDYDHTWHRDDLELVATPRDLSIPISKDQQSTFTFDPEEI